MTDLNVTVKDMCWFTRRCFVVQFLNTSPEHWLCCCIKQGGELRELLARKQTEKLFHNLNNYHCSLVSFLKCRWGHSVEWNEISPPRCSLWIVKIPPVPNKSETQKILINLSVFDESPPGQNTYSTFPLEFTSQRRRKLTVFKPRGNECSMLKHFGWGGLLYFRVFFLQAVIQHRGPTGKITDLTVIC